MSSSEIPPSVKSPWSLQADYANPELYGWASMIVGILALLLGVPMLLMSARLSAVAAITGLGALLLIVGIWMVKRGE